jgi:KDO2-lipid IV(A) lauroyltransferase
MSYFLYLLVRSLLWLLRLLPLRCIGRLGRAGGALAYALDGRHRRVAVDNLTQCFGESKTKEEIAALARENFKRIGENFASAVKTSSMSEAAIRQCVEMVGAEHVLPRAGEGPHPGRIIVIGHFGNFELYARCNYFVPGLQFATTYRGINQPWLNRLLQDMRNQSGCLYFERRSEGGALRHALQHQGIMLGLLVDQHAGDHGLRVPFFGRDCSTSPAPGLYAQRYRLPLHAAICYRVGLGRWRIEMGEEIPTFEAGKPRSSEAVAADINKAYEAAIRRDPANWFWVHRRWKTTHWRTHSSRPGTPGSTPD